VVETTTEKTRRRKNRKNDGVDCVDRIVVSLRPQRVVVVFSSHPAAAAARKET